MKTLVRLMLVASVALMPALVFAGPAAGDEGGKKVTVAVCKQSGLTGAAFRNQGQCVSSAPKGGPIQPGPQPSWTLEVDQGQPYDCNPPSPPAQCWGVLSGSGLVPFSVVHVIGNGRSFTGTHATVTMDGTVNVDLAIPCYVSKVQAQGRIPNPPDPNFPFTDPTQPLDPPNPCSTG